MGSNNYGIGNSLCARGADMLRNDQCDVECDVVWMWNDVKCGGML